MMIMKTGCFGRLCVVGVASAIAAGSSLAAAWEYQLNGRPPAYEITGAVVPASDVSSGTGTFDDTAQFDIVSDWNQLFYLRDVAGAEMDGNFSLMCRLFTDSCGDLKLPKQLGEVALDVGWRWRVEERFAFQLRLAPGMYSDLEEIDSEAFFIPARFAVLREFHPRLSGVAGMDLRLGFDRKIMPLVGLTWELADSLTLQLGLPESSMAYYSGAGWSARLGFEWRNTSYRLTAEGERRERITLDDYGLALGMTCKISDELQLLAELGRLFERTVEFKRDDPRKVDIEDSFYGRFGIVGPF